MLCREPRVLDIMSSWISHFPETQPFGFVAGIGISELELQRNSVSPRPSLWLSVCRHRLICVFVQSLDEYQVVDLNVSTSIPYEANNFDFVTCTSGIEYLTNPREVLSECWRVLRPEGRLMIVVSDKFIHAKTIKWWKTANTSQRVQYATSLLSNLNTANCNTAPQLEVLDLSPDPGRTDSLIVVSAIKPLTEVRVS
jgi:SAM-dependent methyltransferase